MCKDTNLKREYGQNKAIKLRDAYYTYEQQYYSSFIKNNSAENIL